MKLKDKIALVTGGSSGIGRATALKLAEHGAVVVINYLKNHELKNHELALEVVAEVEAAGGKALAYGFDVSDHAATIKEIDRITKDLGGLHILINNAGMTSDGLIVRLKEEDWDRVIAVNLKGVFNTTKAVARTMMKQRWGRIVNLTSVVGEMGNAGQINYSAAKAGIIGLTKSASKELASRGVTVNAVSPGFIETAMTKDIPEDAKARYMEGIAVKRFGTADEVAELISFLASDAASYITGEVIRINGGLYT